jgi:hypothetical protein
MYVHHLVCARGGKRQAAPKLQSRSLAVVNVVEIREDKGWAAMGQGVSLILSPLPAQQRKKN